MTYEQDLLQRVCCGQAEAMDWLVKAFEYFHAADDLLDETVSQEFKVRTLVLGQELYGHPFFVRHSAALHTALRSCISIYADSLAWERSSDPDKAAWAEFARHAGVELALVVADICGGWDHRRKLSMEYRGYNLQCAIAEREAQTQLTQTEK